LIRFLKEIKLLASLFLKNNILAVKTTFKIESENESPILGDLSLSTNNQPAPLIIFCHGYKGYKDWGAWNLVANIVSKKGIHFCKFNFSLNGGTLNNPIDFPDLDAFAKNTYTQEVNDLNRVINYVNKHYKNHINGMFLVGHSRGGGIALLNANNPLVNGVITWASVADFGNRFPKGVELSNWINKGIRYVINSRTNQEIPHNISFYNDFIENENELTIKNVVKKLNKPQMIIHGTRDQAVLIAEANLLKKWNPNAELITFKASHTFNSSHPWEQKELPKELQMALDYTTDFILS
jgi:pimeloyl-ACP methyl ester carboxylesterase